MQAERDLQDVQTQISTRMRIGTFWPVFELFRDKTAKANVIVHGWLKPLVEKAVREKAKGERKHEEMTFLSHLVDSTDGKFSTDIPLLLPLIKSTFRRRCYPLPGSQYAPSRARYGPSSLSFPKHITKSSATDCGNFIVCPLLSLSSSRRLQSTARRDSQRIWGGFATHDGYDEKPQIS